MTVLSRAHPPAQARQGAPAADGSDPEWVAQLTSTGTVRDDAVRRLHSLMVRAAGRQVANMAERDRLGAARCEVIIQAAADEATMSVLSRLGSFEGRSRFTIWAYKFAILQVATEVRRAAWRDRDVPLDGAGALTALDDPQRHVEAAALAEAVRVAMRTALTAHQQRVMVALVIDHVPIDVLAERLATTRNALYKTLHDARVRLRHELAAQGLLDPASSEEVDR